MRMPNQHNDDGAPHPSLPPSCRNGILALQHAHHKHHFAFVRLGHGSVNHKSTLSSLKIILRLGCRAPLTLKASKPNGVCVSSAARVWLSLPSLSSLSYHASIHMDLHTLRHNNFLRRPRRYRPLLDITREHLAGVGNAILALFHDFCSEVDAGSGFVGAVREVLADRDVTFISIYRIGGHDAAPGRAPGAGHVGPLLGLILCSVRRRRPAASGHNRSRTGLD